MEVNKFLLALTALITICLAANVSAYYVAMTNDGFGLYLTDESPSPYNDVYYYNSYTVSPNYYGMYPAQYSAYPSYFSYSNYGYHTHWYGGYYGYVSPVYGYYSHPAPHQYQYYVYQPTAAYCSAYWCYS